MENGTAGMMAMAMTTPSAGPPMPDFGPTSSLSLKVLAQIHTTAMVNLACSIIISILVAAHMLKLHGNIFKRPIGERLVFYLALGDLCFSISHLTDHAYMLYIENNPPDLICRVLGFFMTSYFNSPCVVVVVTAVNAFVMVVLQRKLDLGRYDWRLLVAAFVAPQAMCFVFACLGWLGPTGVWCGFNYGTSEGLFLGQLNAIINIIIFIVTLLCYLFIVFKIQSVGKSAAAAAAAGADKSGKAAQAAQSKYHKSARVMMIFVVSYVLQYWAITIYYSWEFIASPHISIVFLTVTFTNQGGLFNFFAYTYVRRKYASTGQSGGSTTTTTETRVTTAD